VNPLERTNLTTYLDNHIKNNIEDFKKQLENWYKLFEYIFNRELFSFN